jgi:tetratricopeptide (TPR) repeat protein
MRFIEVRHLIAAALVLFVSACSAPAPKPSESSAPATASPPAEAATPPATPTAPPVPATAAPNAALKRQFAKAVEAMKDGRDDAAITLFNAIAQQNPELASPHTDLGILFYRQGHLDQAEAAFKEALKRDDKDYAAANYLGMVYRTQGRFAEAKAAYLQALTAKPDYALAQLNMAILYDLYTGELDQALAYYRQYQQSGGASDPRLAGWLADLEQRINENGGKAQP